MRQLPEHSTLAGIDVGSCWTLSKMAGIEDPWIVPGWPVIRQVGAGVSRVSSFSFLSRRAARPNPRGISLRRSDGANIQRWIIWFGYYFGCLRTFAGCQIGSRGNHANPAAGRSTYFHSSLVPHQENLDSSFGERRRPSTFVKTRLSWQPHRWKWIIGFHWMGSGTSFSTPAVGTIPGDYSHNPRPGTRHWRWVSRSLCSAKILSIDDRWIYTRYRLLPAAVRSEIGERCMVGKGFTEWTKVIKARWIAKHHCP